MPHKVWTANDLRILLVGEAGFVKAQMLVGSLTDDAETSGLPFVLGLPQQVQVNTGGPQSPNTHCSRLYQAQGMSVSTWGSLFLLRWALSLPFSTLPLQSGPLSAPGYTLRELSPARKSDGAWMRCSDWGKSRSTQDVSQQPTVPSDDKAESAGRV